LIHIKKYRKYRIIVFFVCILIIGTCFVPSSITHKVKLKFGKCELINEGQILFAPLQSTTTYLIDSNGDINHTWSSDYIPAASVYMQEDGAILRTIKLSISGGGASGGVQKITWDGDLIWDFRYYTDEYLSHHDIEVLPNGNILMIAWEYKTRNEAIEAGRDPNKLNGNTLRPDHVIEVEPTGPTSGKIVWEWHVWDHLIQDYDPTKNNYGVVGDHPELIDINFGNHGSDWLHTNSIDYHEEFDQIVLSVREFGEIWVIDHSTTTEEAASHTGGRYGKGGDILYRWGNPMTYRAGTIDEKKLFGQHDATWVEPGIPGDGNIIVYNNGIGRPGTDYTSIDEIVPPVDENGNYTLIPGEPYEPEEQTWIYETDYYSLILGGAQRIPNGNTMICLGFGGQFLEVTPEKEIVWDYENPYPNPLTNNVFKLVYYPPKEPQPPNKPNLDCSGSLEWTNVKAGEILYGDFKVKNIGDAGSLLNWSIESFPNWGIWSFNPESGENLTPENSSVDVQISVIAPDESNKKFEGYIRVVNQEDSSDFDVIPVYLKTPRARHMYNPLLEYLNKLPNLFTILLQML